MFIKRPLPKNVMLKEWYERIYLELLKCEDIQIQVGECIKRLFQFSTTAPFNEEINFGRYCHKDCYYNENLAPWEIETQDSIIDFESEK